MTIFPRRCAMSTFSMMLHYVFFFHAAALCLPFHFDPALCLLFPRSCALSAFSTLLHEDYFHGLIQELPSGVGSRSIRQKKLWQRFFSLVLILFYRSQMVNFKENYIFSRFRRGSNFFQVGGGVKLFSGRGVQLLIPYRTRYNL